MKLECQVDRYYQLIDDGLNEAAALTKVCFEFQLSSYGEHK